MSKATEPERWGRWENRGGQIRHAFGSYSKDDDHFVVGDSHFAPLK